MLGLLLASPNSFAPRPVHGENLRLSRIKVCYTHYGVRIFDLRSSALSDALPTAALDGTSQVLGLRGVPTEDTSIDFFCPESFVGNTVLVLTAQSAAI